MSTTALPFHQYHTLTDAECFERINAAKAQLQGRAVVLGHHYQRETVYRFADLTGDSLRLSKLAASSEADYIIFCGVHFMAEVADIVSKPHQIAILPDMAAGCSMADMANLANVERAWRELSTVLNPDEIITPITYINSAANLKAFCGEHGGIICTSTNARKVLEWGLARRPKILFFPDQHLGRNTAFTMGISLDEMVVWDFDKPLGGLTAEAIQKAKMILWKGFCSVHQVFKPQHIDAYLAQHPETQVISHPECSFEVCQKSHFVGSTEYIIHTIRDAPPNTRWLVGTELNLVSRIQEEFKSQGKIIDFMSPIQCMCSTMYRIDPQHLAWALENLAAGHVVNRITVPEPTAELARTALNRMLNLQ